MATRKRAAGKQSRTPSTERAYKVNAKRGRAAKGAVYRPDASGLTAGPGQVELMEPRPKTTTRYPISLAEFERLKDAAAKAKARAVTAVQVKDVKKRKVSHANMMAAEAPGHAPTAAPTASGNFAGITATGWLPPDCTMAVGPTHVLASVNSSLAIYTKAGAVLLQRTLTQWFTNVAQGLTIFDPKALYDQHAGRWVLMAVAVNNSTQVSVHLLSISNSSDPMGPWRNYKFDAKLDGAVSTNNWADFPAIGVDNQALYITSNMFAFGGGFAYSKIRVIPKAGPYAGGPAPFFDFVKMKNADNTMAFTIQPCHTFGAPQVEYLVNTGFPSANYVTLWQIVNGGTAPVLTRKQVSVSAYSLAPNADQAGGAMPLNTGDVRVLHAVFRGDSLWTSFTTAHKWGTSPNRASIQWCQIRAAAAVVVQQGVYGAATGHYFYPAICPDANGNVTMVFSRSGPTEAGSIAFTGRLSTDPVGTMQGSAVLKAGTAKYVAMDGGGRNRWGDYNGVASDPANSRVIWFYSMFASALNTWSTWVGSAFF
jgi:hypothetical protein